MKWFIFGICLLASSSAFAYNQYSNQPDVYFYDDWGRKQGSAKENWKGEVEYYDSWGRHQGTAKPSYGGNGYEYYDSWGRKQGSVKKNNNFGY